jgi:hypothetical protein
MPAEHNESVVAVSISCAMTCAMQFPAYCNASLAVLDKQFVLYVRWYGTKLAVKHINLFSKLTVTPAVSSSFKLAYTL